MSTFNDIQPIDPTDTLRQLILKCNANFMVIKNSGGPKGKDGETGETGPRGKRGKSVQFVNYQFNNEESDDSFEISEAEAAVQEKVNSGVLEVEDGDLVFFGNAYYSNISSIDEDGTVHIGSVNRFKGDTGEQGPQGEHGAGDMFVKQGTAAGLNTAQGYSKLNLLSSGSNTLNVGGSIGLFNSNTQVGTMEASTGVKFASTGDMNIISNNNVILSKNGGGKINIGSDIVIEAQHKYIKINNSGIEFYGNTTFGRDVTIGDSYEINFDNNGTSKIKKDQISSDELKTKNLNIVDNGGSNNVIALNGSTGLNIGNLGVSTNGKLTTTSPIECNGSTISVNGTILDTPKYSFTLYPKGLGVPANWASFGIDLCIKNVECLGDTRPSSLNQSKIYFKYKIPLSNGNIPTKYFVINNPTYDIGKLTLNLDAVSRSASNSPEEIIPIDMTRTDEVINKSERIYDMTEEVYADEVLRGSLDILIPDMDLTSAESPARFEEAFDDIVEWRNYHAELLKSMLQVSTPADIKDMSNTFTRLKKSLVDPSIGDLYTFAMAKLQSPSEQLVWIFKIA